MTDVSNLRDTIVPKSDQLNAEQLLGTSLTIAITSVRRGDSAEQPIALDYAGDDGRPYKPCKTMRKVLVALWGDDGRQWVGRRAVLFCDPDVKFGGVKVGGIRISHMSHIDRDTTLALTSTKGKKAQHLVRKLADDPTADTLAALRIAAQVGMDALQQAWKALPTAARSAIGADGLAQLKTLAETSEAERQAIDHPAESSAQALAVLNAGSAE